jgi:hypothetical protein
VVHPHVYAVASGFGLRVIPAGSPCTFTLRADTLEVGYDDLRAHVPAAATPGDLLAPSGAHVADIVAGPCFDAWWIETSRYRIPLPLGWSAIATGALNPSAFDLVGPGDALVFVQTPSQVPPIERMIAPGQQVAGRGSDARSAWVELHYEHAGATWVQRHEVVRVGDADLVVAAQATEAVFEATRGTLLYLVASVTVSED